MFTIKKETLLSICDKIRVLLNTDEKYNSNEISSCIDEIHEKGKQNEQNCFWKQLQDSGNPISYYYLFSYWRFTEKTYNPQYNIVCSSASTSAQNMFYNNTSITDTKVPIDVRNTNHIGAIFYNATNLKTIRKLIMDSGVINGGALAFSGCNSLENIVIEGEISQNMYFGDSPLTIISMNNIISCLKDYSGTNTTRTLTFKADRENMLTTDEKAVAINKGWTLIWK